MSTRFQEAKSKARSTLHERLAQRANCYLDGPSSTPQTVTLRVNTRLAPIGSLTGSGFTYAERWEDTPRLIFRASEHRPVRGSVYSLEERIAYKIDSVEPPDGITISAESIRLPAVEADRYEPPDAD